MYKIILCIEIIKIFFWKKHFQHNVRFPVLFLLFSFLHNNYKKLKKKICEPQNSFIHLHQKKKKKTDIPWRLFYFAPLKKMGYDLPTTTIKYSPVPSISPVTTVIATSALTPQEELQFLRSHRWYFLLCFVQLVRISLISLY